MNMEVFIDNNIVFNILFIYSIIFTSFKYHIFNTFISLSFSY